MILTLEQKMLAAINSKAVITNKGTGDVYAARECERQAKYAMIDMLWEVSVELGNDKKRIPEIDDRITKLKESLK